jgi:hypothetical protein
MKVFLLVAALSLLASPTWAAGGDPPQRKYRSGKLTFQEVLRDQQEALRQQGREAGARDARDLLSRPARKQLNRMSAGRSKLNVDKDDPEHLSIEEQDPKTGAIRRVEKARVANGDVTEARLVATTRSESGQVATRARGENGTEVSSSFEVGPRIPRLLRGVPGSENIRRGDKVSYQFGPDGSVVRAKVVRSIRALGRDVDVLDVALPAKPSPAAR